MAVYLDLHLTAAQKLSDMTDFTSASSIRLSWEAIQSPYVIGTALSFIGFLIWIHGALTAQGRNTGRKVLNVGPLSPVDIAERFPDDGEDDSADLLNTQR